MVDSAENIRRKLVESVNLNYSRSLVYMAEAHLARLTCINACSSLEASLDAD
jgi:hypothetical protein